MHKGQPLDDWYGHINGVFLDRNFYKSETMVFTHLSEVVGGLSLLGSRKQKPGMSPATYVPKALAWWLTLCGKVGVKSVEDMLWWKYPGVCPYCLRSPHDDLRCREKKALEGGPDWRALKEAADNNAEQRPRTIDEWLEMFYRIYPVSRVEDFAPTFARFSEEMGELAEALRIFPIAPGSYLSEAADVFAWLMHLQNLLRVHGTIGATSTLGDGMAESYGQGCPDCANPVCTCAPILMTTLNRIAHEAPDSRKSFSASMMTIDEAMARFSLSARSIRTGSREVETTPELLRDINQGVSQLIFLAVASKQSDAATTKTLLDSIYEVRTLTAAHRVTQQSLESLADSVARLAEPDRHRFIEFLQGVGESLWATLLVELIRTAVGPG